MASDQEKNDFSDKLLVIAVSLNLRPDLQATSAFIGATCARILVVSN
jgi:hypothetical protein